jgi:hypothetical protein
VHRARPKFGRVAKGICSPPVWVVGEDVPEDPVGSRVLERVQARLIGADLFDLGERAEVAIGHLLRSDPEDGSDNRAGSMLA